VERVMQRLDAARARAVSAAESHGFAFAAPPRGLFGWIDTGCDTERLAEALLDQGWLIAPGALFHAAPRPSTLMRINFATTQDPSFWQVVRHTSGHISRR
jgi:DNA-binding transcriptional MocR family regulator